MHLILDIVHRITMNRVRIMQTAVVQPHIDIHRVVAQIGDEKENLIIVVTLNEGHRHHLAHYNTAQNLINLK